MNTVEMKRAFLERFLLEHKTKDKKAATVLKEIRDNRNLLDHLFFIDNKNLIFHRVIEITAKGSFGEPFLFYNRNATSTSVEFALNYLKMMKGLPVALKLNFENDKLKLLYDSLIVRAENKNVPMKLEKEEKQIAEALDDFAEKHYEDALLNLIDKALDEKNKNEFNKLSRILVAYRKKANE